MIWITAGCGCDLDVRTEIGLWFDERKKMKLKNVLIVVKDRIYPTERVHIGAFYAKQDGRGATVRFSADVIIH